MMIQGYSSIQYFRAQGRLLIENERTTAIPGIGGTRRVLRGSRAVLPDAVQDSEGPRPDEARRHEARARPGAGVQRHADAAGDAGVAAATDLRQRFLALLWRQEAPAPEAPKADATPDESALVSAFIGRVSVDPVRGSRLVDVSFDSVDPKFAVAGRQHADGRVRRPEPAGQAPDQREHARLAREGARQPAEEGRGERAGARRVPRQAERAVARRQAEHRAVAAQPAERRGHQGEDGARAEGDAVQPDQVAHAGRRRWTRCPSTRSRSSRRTRRSRASRASSSSSSTRRCSSRSATARSIRRCRT